MNDENGEPKIYTYLSKVGLSKEKIYTFLDKVQFKNILGENLGSKILNKIDGFEIKLPSEDEITDFIYNNLEYVKKIFFFSTTREDIYKIVHKNYEFINDLVNNFSDSIDLSGFENLKTVANLFRKGAVYILEAAIAICIILIIIFRASLYKWLMWISVVTLPVSLLFIIIGSFATNLVQSIAEKLKFLFLVEPFVAYFTKSMVKYGIILLIISVSSFIIHTIIKILLKKKKKKEKEEDQKLEEALG